MKAILIDDERSALNQLERLLQNDGRLTVAGKYTSAKLGIEHLSTAHTDVIFLDIGMPEMNGLEAAEWIEQLGLGAQIVFITAYSEYAIEAFELQALDYVLKPVHPQRLGKTIDRIVSRGPAQPVEPLVAEPDVRCFQRLELTSLAGAVPKEFDGKPFKWRTLKSQELFAYMVQQRGEWVNKQQLLDDLWPEYTMDKAVVHLHTTVYQIRKMLKEWLEGIRLEFNLDRYRLNVGHWSTDVDAFEQAVRAFRSAPEGQEDYEQLDRALQQYRGHYLEDHDYVWAYSRQEELRELYVEGMLLRAREEHRTGHSRKAAQRLLQLQEKEPYSEQVCTELLRIYDEMGNHTALIQHYERFSVLLYEELGVEPSADMCKAYERYAGEQSHTA
ncbi:response regulator [Paenibacillus massiliensis]|uniref:response regulator n=1 Tax=Paenibacillus massiliensis TaxID=225917 RepID=UPI000429331D|nr:response regulator [Paenibacillus massiliensis]